MKSFRVQWAHCALIGISVNELTTSKGRNISRLALRGEVPSTRWDFHISSQRLTENTRRQTLRGQIKNPYLFSRYNSTHLSTDISTHRSRNICSFKDVPTEKSFDFTVSKKSVFDDNTWITIYARFAFKWQLEPTNIPTFGSVCQTPMFPPLKKIVTQTVRNIPQKKNMKYLFSCRVVHSKQLVHAISLTS